MKSKMNIIAITIFTLILTSSFLVGQDKMDHSKMNDGDKKGCCSDKKDKSGCSMDKDKMQHSHSIDVKAIDKNKDGKVFACAMCPDEISDEAGKCSKCDMERAEVTIKEAEENLMKSNMMNHDKMMEGHGNMEGHSKMMKGMDHSKMKEMDHDKMGKHHDKTGDSIVREGAIDVASIDHNGDGKVFQDTMDWNVISDEAGKCPICGMTLKEVSIDDAKKNLKKNGFKIK